MNPATCKHEKVMPAFDEEASKGLSSSEVRKLWPRFSGMCPDCKSTVVAYKSMLHYIAGDW
jgi:hypothetical protein